MVNGKAGVLDRVAWCPVVPPTGAEALRVESVEAGKRLELALCSLAMTACWLHWCGGRSLPCLAGRDASGAILACPARLHASPVRWKGYVAGVTGRDKRLIIAQVTYEAARRCPDLFEAHASRSLRGRVLVLTRQAGHRQARVTAELSQHPVAIELPPPPDIRAVLHRLWWSDPLLAALTQPSEQTKEGGTP